jgi:hypothetical protein
MGVARAFRALADCQVNGAVLLRKAADLAETLAVLDRVAHARREQVKAEDNRTGSRSKPGDVLVRLRWKRHITIIPAKCSPVPNGPLE